MPKSINLKDVRGEESSQLMQFFTEQAARSAVLWKRDLPYALNDGTQFIFRNDMFQRQRDAGGVRYEVISNKEALGSGAFGEVKLIKGTVKLDQVGIHFKKEGSHGKRRIVKIQRGHYDFSDYFLEKEYQLSRLIDHLAIKKPTTVKGRHGYHESYTVMRKLPGSELFNLFAAEDRKIVAENRKNRVLTLPQRIQLTRALLWALKQQVTDRGIVHLDIKGENILVDIGSPITVHIIDFGMSCNARYSNGARIPSGSYVAPELKSIPSIIGPKADVYSMARVLALLWGVGGGTYQDERIYPPKVCLTGLFTDITGLSESQQVSFRKLLSDMLQMEVTTRLTIDEAIAQFDLCGLDVEVLEPDAVPILVEKDVEPVLESAPAPSVGGAAPVSEPVAFSSESPTTQMPFSFRSSGKGFFHEGAQRPADGDRPFDGHGFSVS